MARIGRVTVTTAGVAATGVAGLLIAGAIGNARTSPDEAAQRRVVEAGRTLLPPPPRELNAGGRPCLPDNPYEPKVLDCVGQNGQHFPVGISHRGGTTRYGIPDNGRISGGRGVEVEARRPGEVQRFVVDGTDGHKYTVTTRLSSRGIPEAEINP